MNYTEPAHPTLPQRALDSRPGTAYLIVVNAEGQHSIWPSTLAVPAGWRPKGPPMRKEACLAAITTEWPDIAPASVRAASLAVFRARRGTEIGQAPRRGGDPAYVHEAFGERASGQPDAIAVVSTAGELTYRQLSESANQLAHHLQGRGVGPETLVGVGLERGAETIRCLLAVLAAGGAYLPMDPSLPGIRLAQMRDEAGVAFVLTNSGHARAFSGGGAPLLLVDELAPEIAAHPVTAPIAGLQPANLAYAIWTSGSTGAPQAFDTSLEQVLATLLSGATLMLPGASPVAPSDLVRYLAQQRMSVADLTPAYWHQILADGENGAGQLGSLRLAITGGDQANAADCRVALRRAPGARLINAYGLTETTITSALSEVTEELLPADPGAPVPVGKPLPLAQVLVLDEDLNPIPAGVTGEIYIGGHGVARGYLGQPGLTAEFFMPNPHAAAPGARMYRTGDLGRWRQDQNLEVLGRADRQIKVRGFRVEPGEIESVLGRHPDIDRVAVIAHELGGGDKRITAYYTLRDRSGTPAPRSAESLRGYLSGYLPDFMIPAAFVPLDRMPLTPEGQVDRPALAIPAVLASAVPASTGPASTGPASTGQEAVLRTPVQAGMGHLWAQVLGIQQVNLDDDFFRLGGNSLLAAEMLARARVMFGIDARQVRPLTRCLLRDPTLGRFSAAVQEARAGTLIT